ncbi:MAG TPA: hypothetical protein VFS20_26125, partial [Longimicrobium sp.]|nr:hypothetical protein [Longimicrobium sp.]
AGDAGRDLLVRNLEEAGYRVCAVDSWQLVLAAVENEPFHGLVVTSLNLGKEIDGVKLHRRLAEKSPGIATVILFTLNDLDRLEDAPLPRGARIVMDGPYDLRHLLSAASDALAEARSGGRVDVG